MSGLRCTNNTVMTVRRCHWYMQPLSLSPAFSRGNKSFNTNARPSSEITHIGMHVPHIPPAATVRGMRLFHSELLIVWLLFEGSVYLKRYGITI